MKNFVNALKLAESCTTKIEKFEALSGLNALSIKLVEYALNPYIQFNVKKWKEPSNYSNIDVDYSLFLSMLDILSSRLTTGNKARELVTETISNYTQETAKYLSRVLLKNLDCGATATTFKKIYPDINIPSFDVMLASKVDEKYKWEFPCIASAKLDGNRLIAIVNLNGTVDYFSRSGKPSDHVNGLFDDELLIIANNWGTSIVVDGEVLGESFQETMNAKGFDNLEAKAKLKFYAFDIMTLDEWKNQNCEVSQITRSFKLDNSITTANCKKIALHKWKVVKNLEEATEFYQEILKSGLNTDGTLNGMGEGLIIKKYDGLYEFSRSKNWSKWKPVIDVDLVLTGMYEGTGRLTGTCGGLELHGFDENGKEISTFCGSGLSDEMRKYFWDNKEILIGQKIQLEAQEICKGSNNELYSLRFPVFIRIRDDL